MDLRRLRIALSGLPFLFFALALRAQPAATFRLADSADIFSRAPFASCHASTIAECPNGDLAAAWFGGREEGARDVCIWLSRKAGGRWSVPVKVADGREDGKTYACWNPVLFLARDGTLALHYKVGPNPRTWWALYKISRDGGATWSPAVKLPAGFLGPIKNKPVQLTGGDILYPSSVESTGDDRWTIHVEISDSALGHWRRIPIDCDTFGAIQPTILVHGNHRLQLLARSRQNRIVQSWSTDDGATWSKLTATELPNPNSGIDAVSVAPDLHVLVYNPTVSGSDWSEGRATLKVALSKDGIAWTDIATLEARAKGEFSYPAIVAGRHGDLFVTYTNDRRTIRFAHFVR